MTIVLVKKLIVVQVCEKRNAPSKPTQNLLPYLDYKHHPETTSYRLHTHERSLLYHCPGTTFRR